MEDLMTTRQAADLHGLTCSAVNNRLTGAGVSPVGRLGRRLVWRRSDVERVHEEFQGVASAGWYSALEIARAAYTDTAIVHRTLRYGHRVMVSRVTGRRCRHWTAKTIRKHFGVDMTQETTR